MKKYNLKVVNLKVMNKIKKLMCVLIVTVILALTMAPCSYATVVYPAGITKEQALSVIGKTDKLISAVLRQTGNGTLRDMLIPEICSGTTLSSVMITAYKALEENAESFAILGLNTSPANVATYLTDYPEAKARLESYGSWAEVNLDGVNWGFSGKAEFCNAAAKVFGPLNNLLYTLLCGGSYPLILVVGIEGDRGYENAVLPVFRSFGYNNYTDPSSFYAQAEGDRFSMIRNIADDLISFVEYILDAPCDRLTDVLPGIAYFIKNGGIENAIATLIKPLKVQVLNISLPIELESFMAAAEFDQGFTFSFELGNMLSVSDFQTAEIDLDLFASCGTVSGDTVVSDKGDTFMAVLRWIIDSFRLNQNSLSSNFGIELTPEVNKMITSLLARPTDEIIIVLMELLNQTGATANNYQWTFNLNPETPVEYTANLGRDKYQRALDGIDPLINEFIKESGEHETVRQVLQPQVYSNKLVSQLTAEAYKLLTGEQLAQVIQLFGYKLTPADLASYLTESQFSAVAAQLSTYYSWSVVPAEGLNWGFKDGDKDGFINAVSAVFRPFDSLLRMVLAQGKLQLFEAIDFFGSDGYNTAIIPVLEAFGVYIDNIPSYEEYAVQIGKTDVMRPIVTSLCTLIERVLDKPVYTITEILPNLLYFINNRGIEIIIGNLLYPVTGYLDKLGLSDAIDISALTSELDIGAMLTDLMNGIDIGITMPVLDINQFQGMGQLVSVPSRRTLQGNQLYIYAVDSDQTAVLVTILRYLVSALKAPGNENFLTSFIDNPEMGDNNMLGSYAASLNAEINAMTVDETVEWLYDIFFRERVTVEEDPEPYMPEIKYEKGIDIPWAKVLTVLLFVVMAGLFFGLANRDRIKIFIDEKKQEKRNRASNADSQEV